MAALEWLSHVVGIDTKKFSRQETIVLEAELYIRIFHEIWASYKSQHKDYFCLIEYTVEKESVMVALHVVRCLIHDILKSKTYTLSGIACYTQTPEEIIQDLLMGHKVSPVIIFIHKLIELHKLARPDIYQAIIKKLSDEDDDNDKEE